MVIILIVFTLGVLITIMRLEVLSKEQIKNQKILIEKLDEIVQSLRENTSRSE